MTALTTLLLATALARDVTPDAPLSIVNGQNEDGYPSTVAMGYDAGGFRQSTCTASLITPTILLTAGHCIEELQFPEEVLLEYGVAFLGPDIRDAEVIAFKKIEVHPGYQSLGGASGTPKNDYAIIELEEPVRGVQPVWFNTDELTDEVIGTRLVSVGYGITDAATQQGGGRKRSAKIKISDVDGQFLVSETAGNPGEGNVCSGDSGGPQYYEDESGRLIQWSVHSWADQYCLFMSGSSRTDAVGDWILGQVDDVHGTTDFCALSGRFGDGTCDDWCDTVDPDCLMALGSGSGTGSASGGGGGSSSGCDTTGAAAFGWASLLALAARRRKS
jgi:secreted trypsin-like serine protease